MNLRRYFQEIKAAGITLSLQKWESGKPFGNVGHIIGSSLKSADPTKLVTIKLIPRSKIPKQLKSFSGMLADHRCYIPHILQS